MAYAPKAILDLYAKVHSHIPSAINSGVVGDANHSFGYHLGRDQLPGSDYSVQLAPDRLGDAAAASALDISLNPTLMKVVTGRLLAAAKARDPRLRALREFCGTLDGHNTYPWDLSTGGSEGVNSWDSSHLWHVHLSFYREYANNYAALAPIADVIGGVPVPTPVPAQRKDRTMFVYQVDPATLPKGSGGNVYLKTEAAVIGPLSAPDATAILESIGQPVPGGLANLKKISHTGHVALGGS